MRFFIGTYTSPAGSGLYPLDFDAEDDRWSLGAPDTSIENCSFVAHNPRTGVYYLLNEGEDTVSSYTWMRQAGWQRLQSLPTCGGAPCFVALDKEGGRVAVANYKSGHVTQYQLAVTGRLLDPTHVYAHAGHGPNLERQDGPHAHCAVFHDGRLYSTDLGTDSVLVRKVAADADTTAIAFQAPPGQGPRHILFHPVLPIAYLLTELGSQVFVLRVLDNGHLEALQQVSTLPAGFTGQSLGGHIAMNAHFNKLYVSNRGHDSLAVFSIGDDGAIALQHRAPTHGQSPRHFYLAEDIGCVIIAHQDGNSVVVLTLESDGGIGEAKVKLPVPQAAFVGVLTEAENP